MEIKKGLFVKSNEEKKCAYIFILYLLREITKIAIRLLFSLNM